MALTRRRFLTSPLALVPALAIAPVSKAPSVIDFTIPTVSFGMNTVFRIEWSRGANGVWIVTGTRTYEGEP
jgi:hypothetical protein